MESLGFNNPLLVRVFHVEHNAICVHGSEVVEFWGGQPRDELDSVPRGTLGQIATLVVEMGLEKMGKRF
jgi:hypothetical protein